MDLTPEQEKVRAEACAHVEKYKERLVAEYIIAYRPLRLGFMTVFMAGSPGSGKTEFAQDLLKGFNAQKAGVSDRLRKAGIDPDSFDSLIVRIDVDEIREFLPQYQKGAGGDRSGNAHVINPAATRGLDILRDFCFEHDISFLHDGTFGNLKTMRKLVRRSLDDGRGVVIYYIYADPLKAWSLTQAREYLEGRNILKEKFIEQYERSLSNVDEIKREFGDRVLVHCIVKDSDNHIRDTAFNVSDPSAHVTRVAIKYGIPMLTAAELRMSIDSV